MRYPLPELGPGPAPGPCPREQAGPPQAAGWRALLGDGGPVAPDGGACPHGPGGLRPLPVAQGAATEKPLLMGTRDSTMRLSWWRTPGPLLPGPHRWAGSVKTLRQQRTCTENQSSEKPERPPKTPTQPLAPSGSVCSVTPAGSTPGSAPSLPRPPAAAHLPVPSAPVRPPICLHTFGGNLRTGLQSCLDPSRPTRLSALRDWAEAGDLSEEGRDTASFGLAAPSSGSGSPLPPLLPAGVSGPRQHPEPHYPLISVLSRAPQARGPYFASLSSAL